MKNILRKITVVSLLVVFLCNGATPVFAAVGSYPPHGFTTSKISSVFTSKAIVSGNPSTKPPLLSNPGHWFTQIKLGGSLKSGDKVKLVYIKWDGTQHVQTIYSLPYVSTTTGYYWFYFQLITSSTPGYRQVYYDSAVQSQGNTRIWEHPDPLPSEPPPSEPPVNYEPPPPPSTSDIADDVSAIKKKVSTISSDMNSNYRQVKSRLDSIKSRLGTINSDMNNQFSQVKRRLDVISDDVGVIRGDVRTMKNYFTTPRRPAQYNVEQMPEVNFDSRVDISEPYQEPYRYNRPDPVMPSPVGPPEPLPYAPDPQVMPHDDPIPAQDPSQLDEPLQPDPVKQKEPVNMDPPREQEPVKEPEPVLKEPPLAMDPVIMEPPQQRESPKTPETPKTPEIPLGREPVIAPEPPLGRQPAITPDPPLSE